ncbi:hypothetical protein HPB52_024791 [Rhipicephalus sanguineus]|uniref:Transposase n=1 Tax=Rhipicephalus sanguineus TaxID=34632 RepID=A0A9D4TDU5_RHISA|nr:hypothetical protein HPB52_024791 [Rhipicephalus sanguineus]
MEDRDTRRPGGRGRHLMNRRKNRCRIIDVHRRGDLKVLSETLGINIKTVRSIAATDRDTAKTRGGSSKKFGPDVVDALQQIVQENPSFTLEQIKRALKEEMPNIEVSTSTIDRLLDGHGYSVKLLTQRPVDRNRADVKQLRRRYAQWLQSEGTTLTRYYIDETNFNWLIINLRLKEPIAINVRQAVEMLTGSRWNLKTSTISNCWGKAGLIKAPVQLEDNLEINDSNPGDLWTEDANECDMAQVGEGYCQIWLSRTASVLLTASMSSIISSGTEVEQSELQYLLQRVEDQARAQRHAEATYALLKARCDCETAMENRRLQLEEDRLRFDMKRHEREVKLKELELQQRQAEHEAMFRLKELELEQRRQELEALTQERRHNRAYPEAQLEVIKSFIKIDALS